VGGPLRAQLRAHGRIVEARIELDGIHGKRDRLPIAVDGAIDAQHPGRVLALDRIYVRAHPELVENALDGLAGVADVSRERWHGRIPSYCGSVAAPLTPLKGRAEGCAWPRP
jgi:hypothetical protein